MHDRFPNLIWLRTFDVAARLLNFTAAGQELGLTQTAISLHIRSLEAELGCKLFLRQARKLTLTELGQAYALTIRKALAEIDLSTNSLFGPNEAQTLTIKAPISSAALWLSQKLPAFSLAHPGINLRLVSHIWADSTDSTDVDVELRLGDGSWPGMRAVKLTDEFLVPICRRDVAQSITSPTDLMRVPLIHILGFEDNWHRYFSAMSLDWNPQQTPFSVDTTIAAIGLLSGGECCAAVLQSFAETAIRSGQDLAVAGPPVPFGQSHFLVFPRGVQSASAAARQFEDWLVDLLENEAAEGR